MSEHPDPMTPADCDLRGLEWMPLFGDRLFTSETWLLASPEGRCAALALWWAAWKQTPAASLADDDRVLAQLAGYGIAIKAWRAVKAEAMRGFVKCSDGRLYHPVVAAEAMKAWQERVQHRAAAGGASDRKRREREERARLFAELRVAGHDLPWDTKTRDLRDLSRATAAPPVTADAPSVTPPVTPSDTAKTGQDRTGQEKSSETSSRAVAAVASPAALPPPDARTALWTEGLARLRRLTGQPDRPSRTLLGQLCRTAGDDCALIASLLHEAEAARIGDPVPWLQAAVRSRIGERVSAKPTTALGQWADLLKAPKRADFDGQADEVFQ